MEGDYYSPVNIENPNEISIGELALKIKNKINKILISYIKNYGLMTLWKENYLLKLQNRIMHGTQR